MAEFGEGVWMVTCHRHGAGIELRRNENVYMIIGEGIRIDNFVLLFNSLKVLTP